MFEIFNSKVKHEASPAPIGMSHFDKSMHHKQHSNEQVKFRQFISHRTKDVSVSCYLGKEAAVKDYSKFNVMRLSKKDVV